MHKITLKYENKFEFTNGARNENSNNIETPSHA